MFRRRYYRRWPTPVYTVDSASSRNRPHVVTVGIRHRNPAAVHVQEMREHGMFWFWHIGPALLMIVAMIALPMLRPDLPDAVLVGLGVAAAIFIGSAKVPVLARRIGLRGQVVEAVLAHRWYGRDLTDEIDRATRQVHQGSSYRHKYGLAKLDHETVWAMVASLVPDAERWIKRHARGCERIRAFHLEEGR